MAKPLPPHRIDLPHDEPPGRLDNEPSAPDLFASDTDDAPMTTCECPPEGHELKCPRGWLAKLAAKVQP